VGATRVDEPDSPARSRRLARLADRLTAAISPSAMSSACAPGTPPCAANPLPSPPPRRTRPRRRTRLGRGRPGFGCPSWSPSPSCSRTGRGAPRRLFATGDRRLRVPGLARAPTSPSATPSSRTSVPPRPSHRGRGLSPGRASGSPSVSGPAPPCTGTPVGVLIEILLARGRVAEAARTGEDHAFGAPFPARRDLPRRPDRARRTAARPRPHQGRRRRAGGCRAPPRPARYAQPRLVPLAAAPRPRREPRPPRNALSPRHSKRWTAPASSVPPRRSDRHSAPPPRSPQARPASNSSKSP